MSHEQERFLNVSNSPFKTVPQVFRIPSLNLLESAVSNELEAQKSHLFPHMFPKQRSKLEISAVSSLAKFALFGFDYLRALPRDGKHHNWLEQFRYFQLHSVIISFALHLLIIVFILNPTLICCQYLCFLYWTFFDCSRNSERRGLAFQSGRHNTSIGQFEQELTGFKDPCYTSTSNHLFLAIP